MKSRGNEVWMIDSDKLFSQGGSVLRSATLDMTALCEKHGLISRIEKEVVPEDDLLFPMVSQERFPPWTAAYVDRLWNVTDALVVFLHVSNTWAQQMCEQVPDEVRVVLFTAEPQRAPTWARVASVGGTRSLLAHDALRRDLGRMLGAYVSGRTTTRDGSELLSAVRLCDVIAGLGWFDVFLQSLMTTVVDASLVFSGYSECQARVRRALVILGSGTRCLEALTSEYDHGTTLEVASILYENVETCEGWHLGADGWRGRELLQCAEAFVKGPSSTIEQRADFFSRAHEQYVRLREIVCG